ncbi:MAG TPA: hypothetical protein VHZ97_13635 [Pseudonocardiaceae bacterium]|nr:hypothetical protein [Pseudonocardiaceae bacterium]
MLAIILFGVVVLACAVAVVRLARDARIDADSEQDVFERRARARRAAFARGIVKLQSWRQQRAQQAKPVRRVEPATVRFAPVTIRRDREYPTVPAMSR